MLHLLTNNKWKIDSDFYRNLLDIETFRSQLKHSNTYIKNKQLLPNYTGAFRNSILQYTHTYMLMGRYIDQRWSYSHWFDLELRLRWLLLWLLKHIISDNFFVNCYDSVYWKSNSLTVIILIHTNSNNREIHQCF